MEYKLEVSGAEMLRKRIEFVESSTSTYLIHGAIGAAIQVEGTARGYIRGGGIDDAQEKAFQLNGTTYLAPSSLRRITGMLANSITHKVLYNNDNVEATIGTNEVYGRIHEIGGVIRAKNAPFLVFKTDDGFWHRVKEVTMPARPFLMPALIHDEAIILKLFSEAFWDTLGKGGIQ